jgi:hypothetical protein
MRRIVLAAAFALAGCASASVTSALQSPSGQLFCALDTIGGTTVAAIADASLTAAAPAAAPVGISVIGLAAATVQADCAAAAAATGATGAVPVSPPASPAAAPVVTIAKAAT